LAGAYLFPPVNVKEKLIVLKLENTDITIGLYSGLKKQPTAAGSAISSRRTGLDDSFDAARGQPPDQLLAGVANLLFQKNTLVSTLVEIWWTPEVQPADIAAERRSIRGPIACHHSLGYLDVYGNHHMIIVSTGGNPYPSFVAGSYRESCSANILDLYL
jgi:hypothetical protein